MAQYQAVGQALCRIRRACRRLHGDINVGALDGVADFTNKLKGAHQDFADFVV